MLQVWSVRSCEGALKKRGRCLVVNGADVRALTATANMSGRLTLRRAPADQLASQAQPRAVLRVASRSTGDATPAHAAPAAPPAADAHDLEPFLQGLQNDVARLSRAFATLGREANALARSEAEVRARIENGARANLSAAPASRSDATEENVATLEHSERSPLSRNARRRMRLRLRAAMNAAAPPSAPTQNGQSSVRPLAAQPLHQAPSPRSLGSQPPRPAPLPRSLMSQPPRPAPPPHLLMSQPPRPPPAPFVPPSNVFGGPSNGEHNPNQQQQRTNKKKRRHRR